MDINIYEIPLYYISITRNPGLEKYLAGIGFKNINYQPAVIGKNLSVENLLQEKLITIRAYRDLRDGRHDKSGIASLGSLGCTLSHLKIWQRAISEKIPYIIAVEDDIVFPREMSQDDIQNIQRALTHRNGVFVAADIDRVNGITYFIGTHFCVLTNGACQELVADVFPIDIATDRYMEHLDTIGKIKVSGYPVAEQQLHYSSINDYCVKCQLPTGYMFYIIFLLCIITIITLTIKYRKQLGVCRKGCQIPEM